MAAITVAVMLQRLQIKPAISSVPAFAAEYE